MSNIALNSNLITNPGQDLFNAFASVDGSSTASAYTQTTSALQNDVLQTSSNLSLNPNAYNLNAFGSAVSSEILQDEQLLQVGNLTSTDSAQVMSDLMALMSGASSQTASIDPNFSSQIWQQVGAMGGTSVPSPGFTFNGSTSGTPSSSSSTLPGSSASSSSSSTSSGSSTSSNVNEKTNTYSSDHDGHIATVTITGRTATIDDNGRCSVEKLPDGCNVDAKDLARRLALNWSFSDACTGSQSTGASSNVEEATNTYSSDHHGHIATVTITGRTATIDNGGKCSVQTLPDGCNVDAKDLARRLALGWDFSDACAGSQTASSGS